MRALDPIDIEHYSKEFEMLLKEIRRASELLLPDAYFQEKESLDQVVTLLQDDVSLFDWVLNTCSVGVIFNESINVNATVESNVNQSVLAILWHCQDLISDILLLGSDLDDYLLTITVDDPLIWKLEQLVDVQHKFSKLLLDLEEAGRQISYLIGKLDD